VWAPLGVGRARRAALEMEPAVEKEEGWRENERWWLRKARWGWLLGLRAGA
jgi:hypothetical protein